MSPAADHTDPDMPGSPVDVALESFRTSWQQLLCAVEDGGFDHYDDLQFQGFMQGFERIRNQLPLIDHHVVGAIIERDLPSVWTQGSPAKVLTSRLRISAAEANRRVRAATAVGPRRSMLGLPLDPVRPILAAAQRDGEVSPEQVAIIERALRSVDRPGFDPADIDAGEKLLTDDARLFGPEDVKFLATKIVDAIDPDGTLPDEATQHDRRSFSLSRTRDGAWTCEGRLTGPVGTKLKTLLDALAKARLAPETVRTSAVSDERDHGQRMHDALEDVCDRMLREGPGPDVNAGPVQIIVIIDLDNLLHRTGHGHTSDGTPLTTQQILDLAEEAHLIPACFNATGKLVDLGRTRRFASRDQTMALCARDGGCSFPGCDRAPQWCERHHIISWLDGGCTDLCNLTLLCKYHHHHFLDRGWECRINGDGLPEWIPPKWIDKTQTPLINSRILARAHAKQHQQNRNTKRQT